VWKWDIPDDPESGLVGQALDIKGIETNMKTVVISRHWSSEIQSTL
jgi:hypothetical protein